MAESTTVEVTRGARRAVFTKDETGWRPDWFYEHDRPMLRFKDHEWLSVGHVKPTHASGVETMEDGGAVFRGHTHYGQTDVAWEVSVRPDPDGEGFLVECMFLPEESIELLEAYPTFETPYEYDGDETVTTVIGMNPVVKWAGAERLTPPIWENPAWIYSRPQIARITAPCNAPYLCQSITGANGVDDRYVTVVADWNVCKVHDLYMCPTRDVPKDPGSVFGHKAEVRGYKYIAGALNWSSAFAKDPNVLFAGREQHRLRNVIDYASTLPAPTFDAMLLAAWQRAAAFDLPADGAVEAAARAEELGASWSAATGWLRDVFCAETMTEDLYKPGDGICTYAKGSRPKAGDHYTWSWWPQWGGLLHYRARLTGDADLQKVCDENDAHYVTFRREQNNFTGQGIATKVSSLPSILWACLRHPESCLHESFRPMLLATAEFSAGENAKPEREYDTGAQAAIAEALLLGYLAYGETALKDQAVVLLDEMADRLDGKFWRFNVGRSDSLAHGGQIRSLGHGHAVLANLLMHRVTGDRAWIDQAHRFARYLLSVSYATHNGSQDPDFDWRGWCNGSNAGRDQIAEFPPWETQNGLLCLAALMDEAELEPGFYDALWYIARTGLAQFPAARAMKRILDPSMQVLFVPREEIASERDFYDILPYLAYENPHDQTLQASYQGTDCMVGEYVYGGGLVQASDARVSAFVPRAALLDLDELATRRVHVWNPTPEPVETTLTAAWPDGGTSTTTLTAPPREVVRLDLSPGA